MKSISSLFFCVSIIVLVRGAPTPRDATLLQEVDVSETDSVIPLVYKTAPTPTDGTDLQEINDSVTDPVNTETSSTADARELPLDRWHGRVPCPHEEAAEDPDCQMHCLPKGYSYGICVSYTCTCV